MSYVAHICDDLRELLAEESEAPNAKPANGDARDELHPTRIESGVPTCTAKRTGARASRVPATRG